MRISAAIHCIPLTTSCPIRVFAKLCHQPLMAGIGAFDGVQRGHFALAAGQLA